MARDWREFPPQTDIAAMTALQGMSLLSRSQWEGADHQFAVAHRSPYTASTWMFGRRLLGTRFRAMAKVRGVAPPSVAHEAMLIYIAGAVVSLTLANDPKSLGMRAMADGLREVSRQARYQDARSMISAAKRYREVVTELDDIGAACIVLSEVRPPVQDLVELAPIFSTVNYAIHEWPYLMRGLTIR